ncbi:MAG: hypothetical protein IJU40_02450 [Desulfovibrionaceae bacterium]|nr:hypothetical protein [Desulfovibrionaceae bacterium]
MTKYSVSKQLSKMTNVGFSIMGHGTNCILTLFQKEFSNYIEFFSSAYIVYHCTGIIKLLGLNYIPLPEFRDTPVILKNHHNGQFCNITVPIKQFDIILSNLFRRLTSK